MSNVMIDIETMSTRHDALVLSIGAVEFDLYSGGPEIHRSETWVLDVREQLAAGRHVDPDTQAWWLKQSDEARKHWIEGEQLPMVPALINMTRWLRSALHVEPSAVWANGVVFDVGILESMLLHWLPGATFPWHHRQVRDARTIYKVCPGTDGRAEMRPLGLVQHHPVADCISQIWRLWAHWPHALPYAPEQVAEQAAAVPPAA